jgi:pimeloyl-ACP methyl ester carboxylesterase
MSFCFFEKFTDKSLNKAEIPLVFIPGWGFDARIVSLYDLFHGEQLIVPRGFVRPADACNNLLSFLDESGIEKVNIVGWSMGANIGFDFACRNAGRVASLDLLSMRRQWPKVDVDSIRQGIINDLSGFMSGFYRKCFLGYRQEYSEFSSHLQDEYLHELHIDTLLSGLDYLEQFTLPAIPSGVEIHLIHGAKDIIAPVEERAVLPGIKETLLPNAGHGVLFDCKSLPVP